MRRDLAVTLGRATIARRARSLFEADVQGEIVALCPKTSNCFGFNNSASALWRLLETPQTLGQLVDRMTAQFAVDEARCVEDVSAALRWLEREGLVSLEAAAA